MRVWTLIVVGSLSALAGCTRERLPAHEVGRLLEERHSNASWTISYRCQDGEGDWEYICDARHEPLPHVARRGLRPLAQKVGVRTVGSYQGLPYFSISVLPDEGPVPSMEELSALREREAAEAAAESKARLKYATPK